MKKVCVVLVTFNRKDYLKKLIGSLLDQTYKVSGIVIVNNNSSDGTEMELYDYGFIEKNIIKDKLYNKLSKENIMIHYYSSSINTGGSGGFNKAFDIALSLKNKYDYIWAMDDDVLPDKNCLEILVKNMSNEVGLCVPNRNCEGFEDLPIIKFNRSNPFLVFMQKKKKIRKLENKNYYIEDMPFEGPLFSFDLVKKVGLPDKNYFIFYDDSDYCIRCIKYTKALYVTSAILNKQIIPKKTTTKKMNWRYYYLYRNCILFDKKHGENWFVRNITPRLFIFEIYVKNFILFRFYNFKVIHMAAKDGFMGISGKTVEPGSF